CQVHCERKIGIGSSSGPSHARKEPVKKRCDPLGRSAALAGSRRLFPLSTSFCLLTDSDKSPVASIPHIERSTLDCRIKLDELKRRSQPILSDSLSRFLALRLLAVRYRACAVQVGANRGKELFIFNFPRADIAPAGHVFDKLSEAPTREAPA